MIKQQKPFPDKVFWKSLHSYLFFGCNDTNKRSPLCQQYPSNLTDLNNIETTSSQGIQNTDQKLIDLFEATLASLNFHSIDIGTLFDYILYQNETDEEDKFDKSMEDSFRLTLCFYINILSSEKSILKERESESESMEGGSMEYDSAEDVGRRIIRLLKKIVYPAFTKFIEDETNKEDKMVEVTTERKMLGLHALIASKESENTK